LARQAVVSGGSPMSLRRRRLLQLLKLGISLVGVFAGHQPSYASGEYHLKNSYVVRWLRFTEPT